METQIEQDVARGSCIRAALLDLCATSCAQRYSFREYIQGLGNPNITSIQQDRVGYLWMGTQNGLYRYDGSQFQRYGAAEGIPDRIIDNVFIGLDGTLWVGTTAGVYFERKDGRFSEVRLPYPLNEFTHPTGTTFAVDQAGRGCDRIEQPWCAAEAPRYRRLDRRATGPEGRICVERALWTGWFLVVRLRKGSLPFEQRPDDAHAHRAYPAGGAQWLTMMVARNGHIWLRSNSARCGNAARWQSAYLRDLPGEATSEAYTTLVEDKQGRILTAQGSELALWEKDHWRLVTDHNGLSPFEVQELFVDREGSIWMGVVGHGLLRWVGEDRWEGYTQADGLSDNLMWAVQRDHQGRLWIGTESGLDWIPAGGNAPKIWHSPGVHVARAGSLEVTADGAIWMGSMAGSLTRIDPKSLSGKQQTLPAIYRDPG